MTDDAPLAHRAHDPVDDDPIWRELVDRLDTTVTPADLAAAQATLRELAAESTSSPRRAGVVRWLAAAIAMFGLNATTLALGACAVGTTVTTVLLWPQQRYSNETMPFALAVRILLADDDPHSRSSATGQVFRRMRAASRALQKASDSSNPTVAEAGAAGLAVLRSLAAKATNGAVEAVEDRVFADAAVIGDETADATARLAAIERTLLVVRTGLAAMHAMPTRGDIADANRNGSLKKLATGNLR